MVVEVVLAVVDVFVFFVFDVGTEELVVLWVSVDFLVVFVVDLVVDLVVNVVFSTFLK